MRRLVPILLILGVGVASADNVVLVRGRVVDADGAPVADAEVASSFQERLGSMTSAIFARTGEDGRYQHEIHRHGGAQIIFVLDADRQRGAVAPISSTTDLGAVDLKLGPLGEVLGDLGCEDLGFGAERAEMTVLRLPQRAPVATRSGGSGPYRFLLPPGRYLVTAEGKDHCRVERTLEVPVAGGEVEMDEVFLSARPYTKLWGERAPAWTVGAVSGAKEVSLEGLRDKWILLLFCDVRSDASRLLLEELEEFWAENKRERERFVVVAFHAAWAKRFEDVEAALGSVRPTFPQVLDPGGETQKAYRVEKTPRLLLIDPDGYLIRGDAAFVAKHFSR